MTFARAKPVDDLSEAVAGSDLVVVPDAPLASALNRRLDRPHLGPFATTPRCLAAGRRETAEDRTAFLDALPVEVETVSPDLSPADEPERDEEPFRIDAPDPDGPAGLSPHSFMSDAVFEDVEDGRARAFGTRVHEFAEDYADGRNVAPEGRDEERVAAFLDSLDGELRPEVEAFLPLSVDGERVTVSGVVDLVHVTPDRADVVDYETDRGRHAEAEYRKQLSVYRHVVAATYPDREVAASVLYTATGERVAIEPYDRDAIREFAREANASRADPERRGSER